MFRQVLDDPVGVLLSAVELAPVLVALAFIRPIRSLAFLGAVRSVLASGKNFDNFFSQYYNFFNQVTKCLLEPRNGKYIFRDLKLLKTLLKIYDNHIETCAYIIL
jgi:hypothetical protein